MRIASLDYLRGLAAIGIMTYHYSVWTFGLYGGETILGKIGIYGVSIFYVLSGLTMYLVYHEKLKPKFVLPYSIKRVTRIFPLLWFCVFLNIILLGKEYSLERILLNLSGLFGFVGRDQYIPTGAWSIGNELVFYILFPILIFGQDTYKHFLSFAFVLSLIAALYFAFFPLMEHENLTSAWKTYIHPFNQFFLFVGGAVLAHHLKGRQNKRIGIILLIIGLAVFVPQFAEGDLSAIIIGKNRLLYSAGCFLIVAGTLMANTSYKNKVSYLFEQLGLASYSIYLIHPIVYWYLTMVVENTKTMSFVIISGFVSIVLSLGTYYLLEKRFMNYGRKVAKKALNINYRKLFLGIFLTLATAIIILQANKRNKQQSSQESFEKKIGVSNSDYAKLITQRSIYRDSIYLIYVANIDGEQELIFIKKDSLTVVQRESKFFVHLYPKDSSLIKESIDHIALDFKNNPREFHVDGRKYYVSSRKLPDIEIKKLNLGQYGFRGDNAINWRINRLLVGSEIARTLRENNEDMDIFEYVPDSF